MPKAEHDNRKFNPCSSCDLVLKFTQMALQPEDSEHVVKRIIETEIIAEAVTGIAGPDEKASTIIPHTTAPPTRQPVRKPIKRKPIKRKPIKRKPIKRKPAKGKPKPAKKK